MLRSLGKALKRVGITVGTVAAMAGATALADPTTVMPIVLALGPWGPLGAIGLSIGSTALLDLIKHRNDPEPE